VLFPESKDFRIGHNSPVRGVSIEYLFILASLERLATARLVQFNGGFGRRCLGIKVLPFSRSDRMCMLAAPKAVALSPADRGTGHLRLSATVASDENAET
jgi:hypothetical protein